MANEISTSLQVNVTQNGNTVSGLAGFLMSAQAGGFSGSEQSVGTEAAALDFGDVANPQFVFVKNLDPNNYIELDANNAFNGFPQKLLPGQGVFLTPETGTIYAKAHTAASLVWVVVG